MPRVGEHFMYNLRMMFSQKRFCKICQMTFLTNFIQGFVSIMKHFALEKIADKQTWFVIDFCQLGFIGKMFKSVELPWLVQFFLMFYNDKPGQLFLTKNKNYKDKITFFLIVLFIGLYCLKHTQSYNLR